MTKKKLSLFAAGVLVAGAASVYSVSSIEAHGFGAGVSNLSSQLAQKLGVSEDKVKEALTSIESERHKEMQAKFEDRLNQLVSEGKLTEANKKLVLAKLKELHDQKMANFDALKNLSKEERRAAMEKRHSELKLWAEQNGIDLSVLGPFGGLGYRGRGPKAW